MLNPPGRGDDAWTRPSHTQRDGQEQGAAAPLFISWRKFKCRAADGHILQETAGWVVLLADVRRFFPSHSGKKDTHCKRACSRHEHTVFELKRQK